MVGVPEYKCNNCLHIAGGMTTHGKEKEVTADVRGGNSAFANASSSCGDCKCKRHFPELEQDGEQLCPACKHPKHIHETSATTGRCSFLAAAPSNLLFTSCFCFSFCCTCESRHNQHCKLPLSTCSTSSYNCFPTRSGVKRKSYSFLFYREACEC